MTNLKHQFTPRLQLLLDNGQQQLLCNGLKGIEKESLRISNKGFIAQTPHPESLGSALTHPHITTDYSEALLEFITPPFADIKETLRYMHNIHQFVYDKLDNEILLVASMPCGINGDESVPIAEYGSSNIGQMKHVYRRGLWYRYGRTMQAIAGIHFNYSVAEKLWPVLYQLEQPDCTLEHFISDSYFGLIRNFQRMGWIILYLFGSSPAICKNFFKSRPHLMTNFEELDAHTLYHPYATSLRMSDIGYKSKNQANLEIDYNSLDGYVNSLSKVIETPYADYEKIGVKVDGEYRQLNSNTLQIENEFYSTIRPKQVAESCEKPTLALKRRGIRYVEVRSLDLNPSQPIGLDEHTSRFLEAFLLTCLLQDSPKQSAQDFYINNRNQLAVAHQGRKPGLQLERSGGKISLQNWANEIFDAMKPVCEILDQEHNDKPYNAALNQLQQRVEHPNQTPSARILHNMCNNEQDFGCYALNASNQHADYFKNQTLTPEFNQEFIELARQSLQKQKEIEKSDTLSFDTFLANYFAQH